MVLEACSDALPARWLVGQQREWFDLAARGPLGFDCYARLRFIPDPAFVGQRESDAERPTRGGPGPSEIRQIGIAMSHIAPGEGNQICFCMFWEGWPDVAAQCIERGAANVDINDSRGSTLRRYFLFRGHVDLLAWDRQHSARQRTFESELPVPAFIWPTDRAWCIVRDVDPHFATVAADGPAISRMVADPRIDAVIDDPDEYPPRYT